MTQHCSSAQHAFLEVATTLVQKEMFRPIESLTRPLTKERMDLFTWKAVTACGGGQQDAGILCVCGCGSTSSDSNAETQYERPKDGAQVHH